AGEFDGRRLYSQADTEEGNLPLAGEAHRLDLSLRPAHAESAGDQDRVGVGQQRLGALGLYRRAVDIVERHAAIVGDAAVDQRFVERLVALHLIDVFADDGDAHLRGGRLDGADDALPALQPRRAAPDVQQFRYPLVQSFLVQRQGQFIDGR